MAMPNPVPFKNLWGNDTHDDSKRNKEKEASRVEEVRKKQRFILDGISKFIEYWRGSMDHCVEYAKGMHNIVQYWCEIREFMDEVPNQPSELNEGSGQKLIGSGII